MIINKITNKNRTDMAIMFGELGFKRGAEIGVRAGKYSLILCTQIKSIEKLYLVDVWDLVFEDRISYEYGLRTQERFYRVAQRRLREHPVCEFKKKLSMEAVKDIKPYSLDFVYIDGAHTYDYVMTDIIEWARKVRKGGIISGDDYKPMRRGNVIDAVNDYVKAHKIATLNLMVPKADDDYPSVNWWFIKQ